MDRRPSTRLVTAGRSTIGSNLKVVREHLENFLATRGLGRRS